MAYVYFIRHIGWTPVKIGFTNQSNVMNRVNEFKTASPFGIELIGKIESNDAERIEKEIHADLVDFRMKGEWFDISIDDVYDIVRNYSYVHCDKRMISYDIPFDFDYNKYTVEEMKIFRRFFYSFYLLEKFDFNKVNECVIRAIDKKTDIHSAKNLWNEWADIASLEKVDNPKPKEKKYFYPKIKPIDFKRK